MDVDSAIDNVSVKRLFVPSLVIAFFSTLFIESLTGIFLVDVATSFFGTPSPSSIAVTSQLVTISSIVSVIFAILLGFLSVSFNHKKLLLLGCLTVIAGIMGCFLAPNFLAMQIFFPIEGIGTVVINAMAFTLVGEFLILEKRPKAIGWILAGGSASAIIGAIMINLFFSNPGSWRSYLLLYALPITLVSLLAVYFGVPSMPKKLNAFRKKDYISSFRQVLLNKSSFFCLIGILIRQANFAWVLVFSATFFRVQLGFSLSSAALIALGGAAIFLFAEILGGALVNRVGRKRLIVFSLIASSPGLIALALISNLWIVLPLFWTGGFILGLGFPATTSLILEQAPESRGTMMSVSTIFVTIGLGIGTVIGGLALVFSGWVGLILSFVLLQLIAGSVFLFLTKDPCKA